MSPLVPALILAGGLYVLVELYYRLEHKPRMKAMYEEVADELGVPAGWVDTLLAIRGLPDGKRDLEYDWGIQGWTEPK